MPSMPETTFSKGDAQERFERGLRQHLSAQRRGRERAAPEAERVRSGLPLSLLDDIKETVGLGWDQLEGVLGTSARTLQRRRQRGEDLTPAESDRLWRLLHVWHLATQALGTDEAARVWLTEPHALLGSGGSSEEGSSEHGSSQHGSPEAPLSRLDTEPGLREVEDMLTVIDETTAA